MAGHSKWANIKRHKAKQDAKRGKLYTKLIREITVSAKLGGGDANANPRLRAALDKAQLANMSKDVVDRAIKRGAGGQDGADLEEVRYEGYGPGGIAIMVDCMTNNRNRTVAEVRHAFTKAGGNLGTDGSVAYLFKKQGQISFTDHINADALMDAALTAGAIDVVLNTDNSVDVITAPEDFLSAKSVLQQQGFQNNDADITMRPLTEVTITDKELAETIIAMIDTLEDLDDVQTVYSNADFSDSVLQGLTG